MPNRPTATTATALTGRWGRVARTLARPLPLALMLALATGLPWVVSVVRVGQIALGAWPESAQRLATAPVAWFLHALAGVLFGALGPLQFVRALRWRFGRPHRWAGWAFVMAGAGLALAGLALLLQVEIVASAGLAATRAALGLALPWALLRAVAAVRACDWRGHRAWMIRAYAIGMGTTTVWLAVLPIQLLTGERLTGWAADLALVGMWLLSIALGEVVARRQRGNGR